MGVEVGFDPILFRLGPLELAWHGLFTMLAVVVGVWLGGRRAGRLGFTEEATSTVVVWAIVGGLVGARLFHVADHLDYYAARPLEIVAVWQGGIAVYGGFIGGILGGWIAARRAGLAAWPLLDAAAPAMLIGQAIGRLGCLANGDAWGAPCGSSPWSLCVTYTHPNALLPADLLGVPTQAYPVYEIGAVLIVLVGLWLARVKLELGPGSAFLVAALGYSAVRFGLSVFRQETVIAWGLQEAQLIALATAIPVVLLLWHRSRAGHSSYVDASSTV